MDPEDDFYGQNANHLGTAYSYTDNGDGTVTNSITGLMWQQSFDHNDDGSIDYDDNLTYNQILDLMDEGVTFAGYNDWYLPSIKEMYSLILFSGGDLDPTASSTNNLTPFLDDETIAFAYGDLDVGERLIDMQCATTTVYVSDEVEETVFGVNFADGWIKGYGNASPMGGGDIAFSCLLVHGNIGCGKNEFINNGDGATGLMWMQNDNNEAILWQKVYAEGFEFGSYSDWRLPDAKELQSIDYYTSSPATSNSAAIDPLFNCTSIINEAGQTDYAFYWSSTTHANGSSTPGGAAVYVAFGRSPGNMNGWIDIHGAGSQWSDPKTGDPSDSAVGFGKLNLVLALSEWVEFLIHHFIINSSI